MEVLELLFSHGKIYVLFYLYLFILSLLESSIQASNLKTVFSCLTMLFMTLFIGLRWEIGTDWDSYKNLFDSLDLNWAFLINVYHFDLGYVFFNAFVRIISNEYSIFLLINSFVTIYLLYRLIIKISPYPNISLFLFYTAFMLMQFMGSNRRMMAMVFVLWGFYYLSEQRKLAFYLMIGLAFLFHRSSIFCLIAIFVPQTILSIKKTCYFLLLASFIGLLQLPARIIEYAGTLLSSFVNNPFVEKMIFYSENGDDHIVSSTGSLFVSTCLAVAKRCIFLFFYFFVIRHYKLDKFTQWFYNLYIIGFVLYLCFIGSFFQMMSTYFAFVEVCLFGLMYKKVTYKIKILVLFAVFLYGFVQMLSALNVYPELYFPYNYWFRNQIL